MLDPYAIKSLDGIPSFHAIDSIGSNSAFLAISKSVAIISMQSSLAFKETPVQRLNRPIWRFFGLVRITLLSSNRDSLVSQHQPSWLRHELEAKIG